MQTDKIRRILSVITLINLLLALLLLSLGCAPLLTGTNTTEDALKVMREQNARGCLYVKAKAQPWADATLMLIGTWGQDPPPYGECWKGLPSEAP